MTSHILTPIRNISLLALVCAALILLWALGDDLLADEEAESS